MDFSDETLVAAYLRGTNEGAFAELVSRHLGGVYSFALRLVGGQEAAEDIAQETFVKAWRYLKKFDPARASFKTWLMRIARNTCVDHLRKRTAVPLSYFDTTEGGNSVTESLADESLLADELLSRTDDAEEVTRALGQLSHAQREVLVLRYEQGLTFDEIGSVLNTPANTVKSRHRRALHQLRGLLRIQPI